VLNGSQRNKGEKGKFSWDDIFYLFLFLSQQLLSPVAGKKNKFISFRERSPDNHTQFQTKMFKIYTRFQSKTAQKPYPLGRHIPDSWSLGQKRGITGPSKLLIGQTSPVLTLSLCHATPCSRRGSLYLGERNVA